MFPFEEWMKCGDGAAKRLRVSEKRTLATSVLATGFPYDKDVNPDNLLNASLNISHIRPLSDKWRIIASVGGGVYASLDGVSMKTLDVYKRQGLYYLGYQ